MEDVIRGIVSPSFARLAVKETHVLVRESKKNERFFVKFTFK